MPGSELIGVKMFFNTPYLQLFVLVESVIFRKQINVEVVITITTRKSGEIALNALSKGGQRLRMCLFITAS